MPACLTTCRGLRPLGSYVFSWHEQAEVVGWPVLSSVLTLAHHPALQSHEVTGLFLTCGTSPLLALSRYGPLECSVQSSCTQGRRDLPHPASPETGPKTRNESVQRPVPLQDSEQREGEKSQGTVGWALLGSISRYHWSRCSVHPAPCCGAAEPCGRRFVLICGYLTCGPPTSSLCLGPGSHPEGPA